MVARRFDHRFMILAVALLSSALAGCGGGGSDESPAAPAPAPPAPPPPPPPPTGITKAEAFRFLNQATFGANDIAAQQVMAQGYEAWIDAQLAQPTSLQLPTVQTAYAALPLPIMNIGQLHNDRVAAWFQNSVRGPDQLRQRMAFALSEIMVVSQVSLNNYPYGVADYYDMLARDAFGNFRTLIQDVTLHPSMGVYLSMLGNRRPNVTQNIRPDENYARELMQLFTVGLVQLNLDGSIRRDAQQQPLPTYDQATIEGFAHVFTGWNWAGAATFGTARAALTNQVQPMQAYASEHDTGAKQLLSYPGAALTALPAGQTPARDLADALDNIVGHPNVAPFIAKQLIQRLVTSNPSPQYIERIATKFNNDGTGVRGNLGAVVKAILLDTEARTASTIESSGKLKEPLLRLTQIWRAYNANSSSGALNVPGLGNIFGQGPLQAGSVFNFFSPLYAPPGEISNQNLVAPELQIATEYLNTQVTNYFVGVAFCFAPAPVTGAVCPARRADTVVLDTSAEMALANDSAALVDKIADRLLAGQISPTLRAQARAQVDAVSTTLPSLRVAEALYLIATSPEFARQQ
jgi:uncharacterized protein (DUF1800 family)